MSKLTKLGLVGGLGILGAAFFAPVPAATALPLTTLKQAPAGTELTLVQERRPMRQPRARAQSRVVTEPAPAPLAFGVPTFAPMGPPPNIGYAWGASPCIDDLGYGRFTTCDVGGN